MLGRAYCLKEFWITNSLDFSRPVQRNMLFQHEIVLDLDIIFLWGLLFQFFFENITQTLLEYIQSCSLYSLNGDCFQQSRILEPRKVKPPPSEEESTSPPPTFRARLPKGMENVVRGQKV